MNKTITFHIDKEDKELICKKAKEERLSASAFCRTSVLNKIKENSI